MPLNEKQFDDQIRFRLTSEQKRRLYVEAKRQRASAADLLREFISSLPPAYPPFERTSTRAEMKKKTQGRPRPAARSARTQQP
jgi:hypothetical protein